MKRRLIVGRDELARERRDARAVEIRSDRRIACKVGRFLIRGDSEVGQLRSAKAINASVWSTVGGVVSDETAGELRCVGLLLCELCGTGTLKSRKDIRASSGRMAR